MYTNFMKHLQTIYGFQERSRILLRFADLVEKHSDELAALETWNNGKPYEQAAKSELPLFVRLFRYYAGQTTKANSIILLLFQSALCFFLIIFYYYKLFRLGR